MTSRCHLNGNRRAAKFSAAPRLNGGTLGPNLLDSESSDDGILPSACKE